MHTPTFRQVRSLLENFGYRMHTVPGPSFAPGSVFMRFDAGDGTPPLLLRQYGDEDLLLPTSLGYLRNELDTIGLMDRAEFDRWARQPAAAG